MDLHEEFYEKILMLVVASVIGAIITLIVQWGLRGNKKRQLKRVVKDYLSNSILPICAHLREEVNVVRESIFIYGVNISLDTHPQLSSVILNSFGTIDLLLVFRDQAPSIVGIIGIIDHLGSLRPRDIMNEYIDFTHDHLDEIEAEGFNEDSEEHFVKCSVMKDLRSQTEGQLNNLLETIEHLESHIKVVIA